MFIAGVFFWIHLWHTSCYMELIFWTIPILAFCLGVFATRKIKNRPWIRTAYAVLIPIQFMLAVGLFVYLGAITFTAWHVVDPKAQLVFAELCAQYATTIFVGVPLASALVSFFI